MTSPQETPVPRDQRSQSGTPPPRPSSHPAQDSGGEFIGRYHVKQMGTFPQIGWTVAKCLAVAVVVGAALALGPFGVEAALAYFGLILFISYHYRYVRQNELAYLLASAAEAQQSLTSALWAYLIDRPRGPWRSFTEAVVLSAVFPGYWFYHRFNSFDHKVYRLACLLEAGVPLSEALRRTDGVASRETILAAAVGEKTGKLAQTLRNAPQWRIGAIWLDLLPRFIYPLCLLLTAVLVVSLVMFRVIPKFERTFADFKMPMPYLTQIFVDVSRGVARFWPLFVLLLLELAVLTWRLVVTPSACWHLPVLRRFYRKVVQSRVLKMLGLLLQTGQPVPQALGVLIESGYFRGLVRQRLETVRARVEQGNDLAHELHTAGLLPDTMIAMVASAAKINNLPWALEELGEHQFRQAVTAAHRFTMTVFPIAVLMCALVIGFIVLSLFSPLLSLMDNLSRDAFRR